MSAGKEKVYEGRQDPNGVGDRIVTVNNRPLHNYYFPHTTGFAWGYGGAGPHGLSLSILCDYFEVPTDVGGSDRAPDGTVLIWQYFWPAFLDEFVRKFPFEGEFKITSSEIAAWMATKPPFKKGGWETLR